MNNFNWQSFLRDNSELFNYKQKVKFPASDYDIDKEATNLDVKEITRICNHALVDFLKSKQKQEMLELLILQQKQEMMNHVVL